MFIIILIDLLYFIFQHEQKQRERMPDRSVHVDDLSVEHRPVGSERHPMGFVWPNFSRTVARWQDVFCFQGLWVHHGRRPI